MKTAPFGSTDVYVPVIGQGTWHFELADEKAAIAALRAGVDAGLTHIDTAEMYGSGRAESIIGRALADRRDEIFLVSKVLPSNASYGGTIAACEASLKRLRTDRLDVYLLHWRGRTPLEETFRAFEVLVAQGKISAYGVSNFDVDDLDEAASIVGPKRIACNQVLYHLEERTIEHEIVPWCHEHSVAVVGYSPFGSGRFPSPSSAGGRVLTGIANSRGITPRQVALAFLVAKGGVFTIPKAAKSEHAVENAGALNIELTGSELSALDAAFPVGRRRGLPML
jgi:diketogulonate reductase-like aldo/keto reductase